MKRFLGSLFRPIVEEAERQIYERRRAEAARAGLNAFETMDYVAFGGSIEDFTRPSQAAEEPQEPPLLP